MIKKKIIVGTTVALFSIGGAGLAYRTFTSHHKVEEQAQTKKDEAKPVKSKKREDSPAIKAALSEFSSLEDFNKKFMEVKDEQWMVPDLSESGSQDSGKTHGWLIYPSQAEARDQEIKEEHTNKVVEVIKADTGATAERIREALLARERQGSQENSIGEQLAYSSASHLVSGENQDIVVKDWKVVDDQSGEQVLKVTFTLANKTDQTIDLQKFAQERLKLAQMLNHKESQELKVDTSNLSGKKVSRQEKATGVIYGKVLNHAPKISFIFGMNRKAGENYVGGLTLNL